MTAGPGGRRAVSAVSRRGARVEAVSSTSTSRHTASQGDNPEWLAAWTTALDELELDVAQAESLLSAPPASSPAAEPSAPVGAPARPIPGRDARFIPSARQAAPAVPTADSVALSSAEPGGTRGWEPPSLSGPLPEELRARAAALLERQLAVAESLTKSMVGNRQQSGFLDKMDRGSNEPRSAYVDRAC